MEEIKLFVAQIWDVYSVWSYVHLEPLITLISGFLQSNNCRKYFANGSKHNTSAILQTKNIRASASISSYQVSLC